jgi:hypothetical protein
MFKFKFRYTLARGLGASGYTLGLKALIPAIVVWFGIAFAAHAQKTYDPAADFSTRQNPNGVWKFGWSKEIAGQLHLYKTCDNSEWKDMALLSLDCPHLGCTPQNAMTGDVPPHTMHMHPGPQAQFSHCVFIAPASGLYDVHATFTAISTGGPRVYILHNGLMISSSRLKQGRPWEFSTESLDLEPGDTIDVAVGVGPDKVFFSDETAFSLTISGH